MIYTNLRACDTLISYEMTLIWYEMTLIWYEMTLIWYEMTLISLRGWKWCKNTQKYTF